jgi:hypothetical protein
METPTQAPPKWCQGTYDGKPCTAWYQGSTCGSYFHLVRANAEWLGGYVKTACNREIHQFDTWERPGIPGHDINQLWNTCPRCMAIMEREDPERYQRSLTFMQDLLAWKERYPDPDRGSEPEAP